jgi:Ca2+ transporting ATPase
MKENLIQSSQASNDGVYINSGASQLKNINYQADPFTIRAEQLTDIVNKYKERDENMQDINYFNEKGGINSLLEDLFTDKTKGITSNVMREEHFGSNKIFRKEPPNFCDFIIEALSDKMIIILICCSIFEIGISLFYIFTGKDEGNTDWIDGASIIIAVIVVVSVGSVTNYKKEMKFHNLNDIQNGATTYNVVRNGVPQVVKSDDLLVGDLIKINYGEILPADLLLVEGNGIKIDESSLTGESNAVSKKPYEKCQEELEAGNNRPSSMILLSGTNVIEGTGSAIVIAVGDHSQKGIIRGTIENAQEDNKTPLENKLNDIADLIGYFGLGSAIVTFLARLVRLIIIMIQDGFELDVIIKDLLTTAILCVSIIVVAIPEGLPLAVTLSLAFSIKKLMDNNNLVRKMHACETMGGATVICTDKTGTLTLNLMFVTRIITSDEKIVIKSTASFDDIKLKSQNISNQKVRLDHSDLFENDNYWDVLYSAIALNVDCTINKLDQPDLFGDTETFDSKNKTDKGFIEFLYQYKSPLSTKREMYLSDPNNYQISPFDSQKKRMTTYVKNDNFPQGYRLFTKGGAENAMTYCNRYINKKTGKVEDLNEDIRDFVNHEINELNKKMMRSLYLCYKDIDEQEYENWNQPDENGLLVDQKDLIFIGIFGLQDTLRQGVKESVDKCHSAGVRVIMVTGDNLITATAIAKDCNIFPEKIDLDNLRERDVEVNPNETNDPEKKVAHIDKLMEVQPYAMTGASFYAAVEGIVCQTCGEDTQTCKCPKSEAEAEEIAKHNNNIKPVIKKDAIRNLENFKKISTNLLVMARSQPLHKYALVLGLKALENVVAVTGDGTNDAPALSKSDVGFSMNDGTDIAKEASDIILMDNNFSSIVIAMIYGRSIYDNIRKFLQFQLTVNFCACIVVFLCSCIGSDSPLASIQMLWVNLIMDSLGSLALATEPPYDELLKRKPTNKNESIINGRMWKHIVFQSLFQIAILLVLYLIGPKYILEYKDDILTFSKELKLCYGLPGGATNESYILYGSEDKWPKDEKFKYLDYLNKTTENETIKHCTEYIYPKFQKSESLEEVFQYYQSEYGGTTHMTLIFDVFVFYTLFNQINCRIIDDSFNTFKRIHKGTWFIIVTLIELGIQFALSQFGRIVFHCVNGGLTDYQWLYCFGLAITTMVFNFIIKIIPLEKAIDPCTKGPVQLQAEKARTTIRDMVNQNLKE